MRRGVFFATKGAGVVVAPLARAAAGNVRASAYNVSLSPSPLPLTKTFPYFVLFGTLLLRYSAGALWARAPPRDRTPVVVAACGVEVAPPAAGSEFLPRIFRGVTGSLGRGPFQNS